MAAQSAAWLSRALWAGQKWFSLLWLSLILYSITQPWQKAQWESPLPALFWIAMLGLGVGWLLSQLGGRALWRHSLGVLFGAGVVVQQVAAPLPGEGWGERIGELIARSRLWFEAAQGGWSNNDPLVLILALTATAWMLGYFSPWCVLVWRRENWVVIGGGVVLLNGLFYLPQPASPFLLFLWASLMLVMSLNLSPRGNPWGMGLAHHIGLLALAGVFAWGTWHLPLSQGWLQGKDLLGKVPLWQQANHGFQRMFPMLSGSFSPGPAQGGQGLSFGDTLPFGGGIAFTGRALFQVEPELPGYWRGNTYDVYASQGWLSGQRLPLSLKEGETGAESGFQSRQEISQGVKLLVPSDLFFATGQPIGASLPAIAESPAPPVLTLPLTDSPASQDLPGEVKPVADRLRRAAESGRLSLSRISRFLPPGFRMVEVEWEGSRMAALKIQRQAPEGSDTSALRSPRLLQPPQEYSVISSVSLATPEQLRVSSAPPPDWVRQRYLSLPPTLPERVHHLAAELTQGKDRPYDKAIAIQNHLRRLTYRQDIAPPPPEADGIDHFLFVSKAGYSQYFSSAMVVLLRSAGVPARLVVGFVSNEYDEETGLYLVRDMHAHGWAEVFFPEYGWVEFEPTPNRPLLRAENPPAEGAPGAADLPLGLEEELLGGEPAPAPVSPPPLSRPRPFPTTPLTVALALFLAIYAYIEVRRWSAQGDEGEIYQKMCRLARWARLHPQPHLTPREYGHRLAAALPSRSQAIDLIVAAYGQWLYGKRGSSPQGHQQLRAAWVALRGQLLKRALRPW